VPPAGHAGLLALHVEPQLTHLAIQVAGIQLTECLGTLGEQGDQEVNPAEGAVRQAVQPHPHLGSTSTSHSAAMHPEAHGSDALGKPL